MLTKAEVLAANPDLKSYRVMLHEEVGDEFQIAYDCFAEDADHAAEQAQDAYPGCEIVSTTEGIGNDDSPADHEAAEREGEREDSPPSRPRG